MKINEKTGLYENYGLWHVPFWQTPWFVLCLKICALLIGIIALLVAYKMYVAYKKRKKVTAWDRALRDFEQLKPNATSVIAAVSEGKDFYVRMTAILKQYLHERFGYDVLGKTDEEVVLCLKEHRCDEMLVQDIKNILYGSVIIKFANAQAAQEQMKHDYELSIALVRRTIPSKKTKK